MKKDDTAAADIATSGCAWGTPPGRAQRGGEVGLRTRTSNLDWSNWLGRRAQGTARWSKNGACAFLPLSLAGGRRRYRAGAATLDVGAIVAWVLEVYLENRAARACSGPGGTHGARGRDGLGSRGMG
eukprot:6173165-Pleurochrysis_carterae.AAC.2